VVKSVVAPCKLKFLVHSATLSCDAPHGFDNDTATLSLHLNMKHEGWAGGKTRRFTLAAPSFAAVHRSFRPALTCTQGIWNEPDGLNWPLLRAWKKSWVDLGFPASMGFATNASTCAAFVEQGILTHCEVHEEERLHCSGSGCPDMLFRADDPMQAAVRRRLCPDGYCHYLLQPIQHTLCLLYAQESESPMLAAIDYDEIAPPVATVVAQQVERVLSTPDAIGFLFPGHGGNEGHSACEVNLTKVNHPKGKVVVIPLRTSEVGVHEAYGLGWQQSYSNIPYGRIQSALPPIPCSLIRRGPWHRKATSPAMLRLDWVDTRSDTSIVWEQPGRIRSR
jgi:hypothetical protein